MSEELPKRNSREAGTSPEGESPELTAFRAEIAALAAKERQEGVTAHFGGTGEFRPEQLTEEDRLIYARVKSGQVTLSEVDEYNQRMISDPQMPGQSRRLFAMFLIKLFYQVGKEKMTRDILRAAKEKNQPENS